MVSPSLRLLGSLRPRTSFLGSSRDTLWGHFCYHANLAKAATEPVPCTKRARLRPACLEKVSLSLSSVFRHSSDPRDLFLYIVRRRPLKRELVGTQKKAEFGLGSPAAAGSACCCGSCCKV